MTMPTKINCRNLWKVYGKDARSFMARHNNAPSPDDFAREQYVAAVRDVSFDVMTGEILVVMGLSGSGKSTLLRCLARLIDATSGAVCFDGHDITKATQDELIELRRHKMGMVFQNFGLLPHKTVLQNICFPLEVQGVSRAEREERGVSLAQLVGLAGKENFYPRELSGGQQQRVGIARSLAVEPDVWFLDEPFSALDPLIRRDMQDEFLRLQRVLNKTIVFVTHDFEEAVRVADRIAIMKDGALVQLGSPEDLVWQPADPYVAEFTRNAPRGKIISVGQIMMPPLGTAESIRIRADQKLDDVASVVLGSDRAIAVVDHDDRIIGRVERERLISVMFQEGAKLQEGARQ